MGKFHPRFLGYWLAILAGWRNLYQWTEHVAIHFCIVGRSYMRRPAETDVVVQSSSNGGTRMSNEDLKKLPCFLYKVEERDRDIQEDSLECAVCLERFKSGENCRLLTNCNHSFHVKCIDSWLIKTPYCPICRTIAMKQSC
ncbi:RING-H2 finger protein ATL74-like [Lycium barbarum]|uniref:RING-H2 finger protein ATL74-like n=1 Tax=Lycium barbarum TaxID=112863 RepID=UPI00293EBCA9|nr:RING-H2 finger protein ATL74-like [Lycium barbarum]